MRRGTDASGFTLLELMVVLAIMASMAALTPGVLAGGAGLALRGTAHTLESDINGLRTKARRTHHPTALLLVNQGYQLRPSHRTRALPAGTSMQFFPTDQLLAEEPSPALTFYPDGSSSGGAITVRRGSQVVEIRIRYIDGLGAAP